MLTLSCVRTLVVLRFGDVLAVAFALALLIALRRRRW